MNRISNIIWLLLLFAFFSCEEPLDIVPNGKSRLVIYSNFSDQKELQVSVSKTRSFLTNAPVEYITNATVMVFSGAKLLEILDLVPADPLTKSTPYYKSNRIIPVADEVYTIKVSAPGFETVTAKSSVPKAIPIESIEFTNTINNISGKESSLAFELGITISDPSVENNYYHLFFYQELIPFSISPEGDTLLGSVQLVAPYYTEAKKVDLPVISHFDKKSFLFKDFQFNGKKLVMSYTGTYFFNPSKFILGNFLVELRSVSEAYYLYHSTLTRQINSTHPLSEGVVIYHNIENGEGIFAGFSSAFNVIRPRI